MSRACHCHDKCLNDPFLIGGLSRDKKALALCHTWHQDFLATGRHDVTDIHVVVDVVGQYIVCAVVLVASVSISQDQSATPVSSSREAVAVAAGPESSQPADKGKTGEQSRREQSGKESY